jgi:hypothetical protein
MFDGRLVFALGASDEALAAIPARRGLALLAGEDGRPILLLPAANLRARVTGRLKSPSPDERRRMPDLQAVTRSVQWRLAHSHFETDLRFLQIASEIWPGEFQTLLAWRPAWFLRVDLGLEYPYFARTQDVSSSSARAEASPAARKLFGPFPSGAKARQFEAALNDAFELCRDTRCLRQSPRGRRCSYGQMGKCLCPCDGTIPAEGYRRAVAEAADFVAGAKSGVLGRLQAEMKEAAGRLDFERAAAIKARLARLASLEGADYAHVAPIEDFRFLLIQGGPSRRRLSAFLADCSAVRDAGHIDLPAKAGQLGELSRLAAGDGGVRDRRADKWIVGLVSHYLFAGSRKRGLILRLAEGLSPDELSRQIEQAGEAAGLI